VLATPRPRWVQSAVVAALVALGAFTAVTLAIYGHGPLLSVDVGVERIFAGHRPGWLVQAFTVETATATFWVAGPVLAVVSVIVARRQRSWRPPLMAAAAAAVLVASVSTGKAAVGRSRIPFAADTFGDGGTSYPSGHTTTAVVVAGVLVLLWDPYLSTAARRRCLGLVAAYAVVTGFSRMYLRQHWFSDVLAGWFLGTAIVCLLAVGWLWLPVAVRRARAAEGVAGPP